MIDFRANLWREPWNAIPQYGGGSSIYNHGSFGGGSFTFGQTLAQSDPFKYHGWYFDREIGKRIGYDDKNGQYFYYESGPYWGTDRFFMTTDFNGNTLFVRDVGVKNARIYLDATISGTTGVGISLELALPGIFIKDLFGRKNDYTGVGVDFGILRDRKGRGLYFTFKKTKKFGVAGSASIEWFGASNRTSSSHIDINRTYIDGDGFELGLGVGPVSGAYSTDQSSLYNRESLYEMHTISLGLGLEAGFVEWDTRTFVTGKRKF